MGGLRPFRPWKLPELWTPCPAGLQTGNAPTSSLETTERFPQLPPPTSSFFDFPEQQAGETLPAKRTARRVDLRSGDAPSTDVKTHRAAEARLSASSRRLRPALRDLRQCRPWTPTCGRLARGAFTRATRSQAPWKPQNGFHSSHRFRLRLVHPNRSARLCLGRARRWPTRGRSVCRPTSGASR